MTISEAKQLTAPEVKRLWELYDEVELTPVQFAELCGVHRTTIYRAIKSKELVAHASEEIGTEGQTVLHPFTELNLVYIISALEKFSDEVTQFTNFKNGKPVYFKHYLKLIDLISECRRELKKIDQEKLEK